MQRIQITFSKTGAQRYIGHLDLHTMWERAARRAGLLLVYTQGFHPQPKINLASALPLGYSSRCEVADIRLKEEIPLADLPARFQATLPEGIRIINIVSVEEEAPPLQRRVIAAEYEVRLHEDSNHHQLEQRIQDLLAEQTIRRQRRGKDYDLRPLIEELEICPAAPDMINLGERNAATAMETSAGSSNCLRMLLSSREGATGRPEEVLDALGLEVDGAQIERTRLIFQK